MSTLVKKSSYGLKVSTFRDTFCHLALQANSGGTAAAREAHDTYVRTVGE